MDTNMTKYLANLGKLSFGEDELAEITKDMTDIINIMDTVKEIDITYDPYLDNHNVYLNELRADENDASFAPEDILKNAVKENNYFVVPKVIE
jgi:aspartyl-tRNA(Asn)/glutamyl-tRNA(Gln) amidotransferase subunit C